MSAPDLQSTPSLPEKPDEGVLVAVRSSARMTALCDALQTAGLPVRGAAHGVEALEFALAEPPVAIVAEIGLPLLDAPRLAEILRSNPHTRGVRFVFLGEEEALGAGGSVGDRVLPAGLRPEDIVSPIQELLERQTQIAELEDHRRRDGRASGELSLLGLGDLVELYHLSRKSGTIELRPAEEQGGVDVGPDTVGLVHLRDGEVVAAETGDACERKAFFRMLDWEHGQFVLRPLVLGHDEAPIAPARALLAEGLRQRGEARRHALQLPSLDATVRLSQALSELPRIVHPLTEEVLVLADLHGRVDEIVRRSRFPDYQVLRTLRTLEEREIVELRRSPLSGEAHRGGGLFDDEQRRRLLSWIGSDARGDAKLLVAGAHEDLVRDLVTMLRGVPGVRVATAFDRDGIAATDLTTLAHIALDGERGIELVHVPIDERFAPLWPLASHAALGTLLLLGAPVARAADRLRAFDTALRELPRSRRFNVVLLPPGQKGSADEFRDHLQLLDQASLFLLPVGSNKEPATLFRSLFARIVP